MAHDVIDSIVNTLSGNRTKRKTLNERYAAGDLRPAFVPKEATLEYKSLQRKAMLPLIALTNRSTLQDLSLVGYSHPDAGLQQSTLAAWKSAGMMNGKTDLLHRHAGVHGWAYACLYPDPRTGEWGVSVLSPSECYVEYDDFVNDPRPTLMAFRLPGSRDLAVVWTGEKTVAFLDLKSRTLRGSSQLSAALFADTEPVVRYTAGDWVLDPNGNMVPTGEVSPLINAQDRVTQAIMDLLLVQTFGAVALRWIAGLETMDDRPIDELSDTEARAAKLRISVERLLTSPDSDTKFGSLAGTPMDPFIRNVDSAIRHFAIVAQVPPNRLLGEFVNVSADAILVARESQESKLTKYRETFGERHETLSRSLCAATGAPDPGDEGHMVWRSTDLRTIGEVFDAATKAHSIGMNAETLLRRSLPWRTEEIDQLTQGYQAGRQELDPAAARVLGGITRQRSTLPALPGEPTQQRTAEPVGR